MTNITAGAIRPAPCARCGTEMPRDGASCPACGLSPSAGTAVLPAAAERAPEGRTADEAIRAALAAEYELVDELGRGGMAIVYRARDLALQRDVAIKVLPLTHTFDAEFVERFQQEARTAARLEHPHIIPIYRVGTSGGVSFFVMKLLRGRTLSALLRERRVLPIADVRRLLREVGGALAYAARQGVVHRDIKPDNIMLDDDGRFVVTDFGIARSASAPRLTATGMSIGTPRYMSPEQARAKPVDGRSDIYSLGVVAYECLTGRVPFDADEAFSILYAHIHSSLPRPALSTSEEWEVFELVERMLAKDPVQRVQNGEELVRLVGALDQRAFAAAATGEGPAPARTVPGLAAPGLTASALTGAALAARVPGWRARGARAMAWRARGARVLAGLLGPWLAAVRTRAGRVIARGRRGTQAVSALVLPPFRWAKASPRRAAGAVAGLAIVLLGGSHMLHAAVHHRTRCPASSMDQALAADGWSVLLDAPPAREVGDALVVHYDVCGMDPSARHAVRLSVERSGGALRRLIGGPAPVVEQYDDVADGRATRRHRRLALGELPAGTYSVEVEVTDAGGRRRRASRELRIEE